MSTTGIDFILVFIENTRHIYLNKEIVETCWAHACVNEKYTEKM